MLQLHVSSVKKSKDEEPAGAVPDVVQTAKLNTVCHASHSVVPRSDDRLSHTRFGQPIFTKLKQFFTQKFVFARIFTMYEIYWGGQRACLVTPRRTT
jgi:hypothetical protein